MSGSLNANAGPRYRHTADESAPYETITLDKLTPILGAEISGIDLSQPLSNRQQDEIHRALAENLVIFFRDQHITQDQHLRSAACSATCTRIPPRRANRQAELMIIHADKDSPRANGEGWHTDVSCDLEPPMGSILYIKKCPPKGGDTLFASMYAAYEALSDRMKAYLDGLTAVHDGESVYRGLYKNYNVVDKPEYPRAIHPVVRTHPVTGKKALYVNRGFTRSLVGLPRDESDSILRYLYEHMENPLFQCRFRWQRTPLPSGTIAASSIARCGTTGRTPAAATGSRWQATSLTDISGGCWSYSIATGCWSTASPSPTPALPVRSSARASTGRSRRRCAA